MLCVLMAATFPLWIPANEFPAVAMFGSFARLPTWVLWLPLIGTIGGSIGVIVRHQTASLFWWLVAGSLALGFLIDQHRLQPWAYQSAIYAIVFATMNPTMARRTLIPLAASVYIYSAAGKFDYQFLHSVGQEFLNVPLGWLSLTDAFDEDTKVTLAYGFPTIELFAGVMLLFNKTRRFGGWVVLALHVLLIAILGPWGLNHSHGVLLWNGLLMVQAWYLFVAKNNNDPRDNRRLYRRLFQRPNWHQGEPSLPRRLGRFLARGLVAIAIVAPATERAGWWDHWTSWALYSPHNSRTRVEFHRTAIKKLPPSAQRHFQADQDGDGWQVLEMDRWSLDKLLVPVYPQARYQLALAYELSTQNEIDKSAVRCIVRSSANRMTGRRQEKRLLGIKEIDKALNHYWLVPR